mmetsp:Transcript_34472/g.77737  ORF Transcript_34472/g.77737 Transcript_34472/m.77737 type:complete len:234 (+) Transcript_34472:726-1427(+)
MFLSFTCSALASSTACLSFMFVSWITAISSWSMTTLRLPCGRLLRRETLLIMSESPRLNPNVTMVPGAPKISLVKVEIGLRKTSTPLTSTMQSPTSISRDRSAGPPFCSWRTKSDPVASLRKMIPTPTSSSPGCMRCSATWMSGDRGSEPLWNPSRTVVPGGPISRDLTYSMGCLKTSLPLTSHRQSPGKISPLLSAGDPSTNRLTKSVPSSIGWKTMPTPTCALLLLAVVES